jgi:hypothetical protein
MPTGITTPASGASLLLAAAIVVCLISSPSAYSAPAGKVENKPLVDAIMGAVADYKAGRFAEALAKAKEADAIPGKPAELSRQIHQMIVAYAMQTKDYPSAYAAMEKMIAAGKATPQRIKELPCGREPH